MTDRAKDLGDQALGLVLSVPAGLLYYTLVKYKTRGLSKNDTQCAMLNELKFFGADLTRHTHEPPSRED